MSSTVLGSGRSIANPAGSRHCLGAVRWQAGGGVGTGLTALLTVLSGFPNPPPPLPYPSPCPTAPSAFVCFLCLSLTHLSPETSPAGCVSGTSFNGLLLREPQERWCPAAWGGQKLRASSLPFSPRPQGTESALQSRQLFQELPAVSTPRSLVYSKAPFVSPEKQLSPSAPNSVPFSAVGFYPGPPLTCSRPSPPLKPSPHLPALRVSSSAWSLAVVCTLAAAPDNT